MKIAILASGTGEKALYIHDFFKEGNRVEISTLLTDNPGSEVAVRLASEGIPVEVVAGLDDAAIARIAENLRRNDVELIVADGYEGEIPAPLAAEYADAIVDPTGVRESPLEIIEAVKKIKDREAAAAWEATQGVSQPDSTPEEAPAAEASDEDINPEESESGGEDAPGPERESTAPPTLEEEWSKALNVTPPSMPSPPAPPQPQSALRPPEPEPRPQSSPESPREPMPPTHLVWSVLATVLCCLIPGIVAIVYSSSVSSKYYAGDIEGAKRASRLAEIWVIVSVVTGIIWGTLYLPLSMMMG